MRAVILAGGKGTRLAPYTTVFPKPLMPVGDTPILELLIRRLRRAGIEQVTLAVGHLAPLIRAYFEDQTQPGITIGYSLENDALGTAAPLRLVDGLTSTFIVMNGDLLTDLDFEALLRTHRQSGAMVTIGTFRREIKIDLGVLRVTETDAVLDYIEKPTHTYLASMGVYVMEPAAVSFIPEGHFDLPDLIRVLLKAGVTVAHHQHHGYWLDIGRPEDYEQAQADFEALKNGPLG